MNNKDKFEAMEKNIAELKKELHYYIEENTYLKTDIKTLHSLLDEKDILINRIKEKG